MTTAVAPVPTLAAQYRAVRAASERLCRPLATEDYVVQSMPDASPIKWHLAHTTWFFETLVLKPCSPGYREFSPAFASLFNSYYNSLGRPFFRPHRGLITRPTVADVRAYREHVDGHMSELLKRAEQGAAEVPESTVVLGAHHEQQHQELMLTDLKHLLSHNPTYPAYLEPSNGTGAERAASRSRPVTPATWVERDGGVREIGFAGAGFAFDNETPRHRTYVHPFALASRPVTTAEYLAFMQDGGYERPELWLSDGWYAVGRERWRAPLYWEERDDEWHCYTLGGLRPVNQAEPVCHLSLYEADAYARWAGARLPTEAEWEVVAADEPVEGNLVEEGVLHPAPLRGTGGPIAQLYGDVWEWTQSGYAPYPGYRPPDGPLGEYNSKFMSNQYVLRGGSCATPRSHIRATYRNFFPPAARWQFTGIRLARDGA
jgi:ergothioneine biosynthesis protein EgtB